MVESAKDVAGILLWSFSAQPPSAPNNAGPLLSCGWDHWGAVSKLPAAQPVERKICGPNKQNLVEFTWPESTWFSPVAWQAQNNDVKVVEESSSKTRGIRIFCIRIWESHPSERLLSGSQDLERLYRKMAAAKMDGRWVASAWDITSLKHFGSQQLDQFWSSFQVSTVFSSDLWRCTQYQARCPSKPIIERVPWGLLQACFFWQSSRGFSGDVLGEMKIEEPASCDGPQASAADLRVVGSEVRLPVLCGGHCRLFDGQFLLMSGSRQLFVCVVYLKFYAGLWASNAISET